MSQPPQGVKISSYILYGYAGLLVLALCGLLVSAGLGASSAGSDEMLGVIAGPLIGACVVVIFAAVYGFIGYSLMKMQTWARIAAIVVGVLALCSFPIGTILGGIVLYYMFQADVKAAFESAPAPMG